MGVGTRGWPVAVALGLGLGGCASIVTGQNQSLSIETVDASGAVAGAQCRLSNNKGTWFVTTPGTSMVQRSFEDLAVRCEHESREPGLLSVKSSTKGMAFGNILFGGVIGAGVDISTGAAYDYPALITVTLGAPRLGPDGKPVQSAPAAAATTATTAAAATAAAPAAAAASLVVGTRFTVADFEPVSKVRTGETTFTVTALRDAVVELNDGAIVMQRGSGKLERGAIGIVTITGIPPNVEAGRQVTATFVPLGAGNPRVPVTLVGAGVETLARDGGSLKVQRFELTGYSTYEVQFGAPVSHRGAPMQGTVYVDTVTGLVVAGHVACVNGNYAIRRELERVSTPGAMASQ